MMTDRQFGVEIEITNKGLSAMAEILRNAGVNTRNFRENDVNFGDKVVGDAQSKFRENPSRFSSVWKVVHDGSVADGCEVVSPILSGAEGLESLKKVVDAINNGGGVAGLDCGLHVHVNARDLNSLEIVNAAARYNAFEPVIDTFVDPRRRGSASRWCNGMRSVMQVLANSYISENPELMLGNLGRYHKLNLAAFLKHGTVEFRQLEGTTDFKKISTWVQFCVAFIESSRLDSDFINEEFGRLKASHGNLPKELECMLNRQTWFYVDDFIYYWNLTSRSRPDVCAKITRLMEENPGVLVKHPNFDCYRLQQEKFENNFRFSLGEWNAGIPAEIVSSLQEIAQTHPTI